MRSSGVPCCLTAFWGTPLFPFFFFPFFPLCVCVYVCVLGGGVYHTHDAASMPTPSHCVQVADHTFTIGQSTTVNCVTSTMPITHTKARIKGTNKRQESRNVDFSVHVGSVVLFTSQEKGIGPKLAGKGASSRRSGGELSRWYNCGRSSVHGGR